MFSIQSALKEAKEALAPTSDSPHLDAEVLLCYVVGKNRAYLKTWPERQLTERQQQQFLDLIHQRQRGFPVAYLIGRREFWSREFWVTPDVLIPRPETELLVELALNLIPENESLQIADLGTGSGIIALTLAAERPAIQVTATDASATALQVAQQNARQLNVANVQFVKSDWFKQLDGAVFDAVISNPPYIAAGDPHLQQGDLRFEPPQALASGEQGMKDINAIAETARNHLKAAGHLLIEHGFDQQAQVQAVFNRYHYRNVRTFTDLAGLPRVTGGEWR